MELQFEKRALEHICCTLRQTLTQEETAEVIVPDSFPDAQSVICATASCVLRGRECRTGSVTISGAIRASALYAPEDGSWPRVLESYMPFSVRIDHPAASETMQLLGCCQVQQADARLVNSRKLLFRVNVGCSVQGFEKQTLTLCALKEQPETLRVKTQSYPLHLPLMTAEKPFAMTEEIELGAIEPEPEQIVCYETIPEVTDRKIVGARAVFKGFVHFRALYLTAEHAFAQIERRLPFSQYCELETDADEDSLTVRLCVTAAELETAAGEKRLLLSLGLTAQCVVSGVRRAELIADAYAVGAVLEAEWSQPELCCILDVQQQTEQLRQQLPLTDAEEILSYTITTGTPRLMREAASITAAVPVYISVLYRSTAGAVSCAHQSAEASCSAALAQQVECSVSAALTDTGVMLVSGAADVRVTVQFTLEFTAEQTLHMLCGGTLTPMEADDDTRPAVILRLCPAGTALWELAKQYASTTDAIAGANNLSGDTVEEEKLLLIPM